VRHEETGLLVPHGDVGALADAFQRLARHPDQVARFGAAARRFAETFSWDRAAADTEAQLLMMLNAAPPERRGS
jgi:glycosyltransferase involved in cell wall biosynthesis